MDSASIHAVLILALPAATAAMIWFGGVERPKSVFRLFGSLVITVGVLLLISMLTVALTPWYPDAALGIGGICLFLLLELVKKVSVRYAGAAMIALATFGLIEQAWWITESPSNYCRMYDERHSWQKLAEVHLRSVTTVLKDSGQNDEPTIYPAGWIEEVVPDVEVRDVVQTISRMKRPKRAWHTWLTGIADADLDMGFGVWFPGGGRTDAANRICIRPRPRNSIGNP